MIEEISFSEGFPVRTFILNKTGYSFEYRKTLVR